MKMATTADYNMVRDLLPDLWRQIDNTHLSYLQSDESPDKLDRRKKLEGYILDYLCLVPHNRKFSLRETSDVLLRSASLADFSGYKLARGWAALARYAANLLAQPWRKEYHTIRLYSGFYKHEVEGSGLSGADIMLQIMGYKEDDKFPHSLVLDIPICPDQVEAVSRDSLIAYVECQIMTQIWEEVSICGGNCTWLDVLQCREVSAGDIGQSVDMLLKRQKPSNDLYSNVKYSSSLSPQSSLKQNGRLNSIPTSQVDHSVVNHHGYLPNSNGGIPNGNGFVKNHVNNSQMIIDNHMYCNNSNTHLPTSNGTHRQHADYNFPMVPSNGINHHQYPGPMQYCYSQFPQHHYLMQPPLASYGPIRQATTMPLSNGYHCPASMMQPPYCPTTVPTGQLIDLSNYSGNSRANHHNFSSSPKHAHSKSEDTGKYIMKSSSKTHSSTSNEAKLITSKSEDNNRRNSAPKSASCDYDHISMPRSDTQPSLSKAREDGMGTYGGWDYVFRNLEDRGYSKDLGDRGNILSPVDSKTLGRIASRDPKRYQQTTLDLEDGLHRLSIEKDSEEELYRTAKINDTLAKIKQENDAKQARNVKKHVQDKEKRKSNSHEGPSVSPVREMTTSDKARLIPKEDAKDKKEMDKIVMSQTNGQVKMPDCRKIKKSVVKCLSSESDWNTKKPTEGLPANGVSKKPQSAQGLCSSASLSKNPVSDTVDQGFKSRLVVNLNDGDQKSSKSGETRWECSTCTYLNVPPRNVCEMCGKSKQSGVEIMPLMSGGRECSACTLVNKREATECVACNTSLKHSPTYI